MSGRRSLRCWRKSAPTRTATACPTCSRGKRTAAEDLIEETTTTQSGLQYDAAAGQYAYVWKSASAWSGTCRRLTVVLKDGTRHDALFHFVK
jgi:hypothetical protein